MIELAYIKDVLDHDWTRGIGHKSIENVQKYTTIIE
jgi:hypothetical protein